VDSRLLCPLHLGSLQVTNLALSKFPVSFLQTMFLLLAFLGPEQRGRKSRVESAILA
jgi:hypothetical protein